MASLRLTMYTYTWNIYFKSCSYFMASLRLTMNHSTSLLVLLCLLLYPLLLWCHLPWIMVNDPLRHWFHWWGIRFRPQESCTCNNWYSLRLQSWANDTAFADPSVVVTSHNLPCQLGDWLIDQGRNITLFQIQMSDPFVELLRSYVSLRQNGYQGWLSHNLPQRFYLPQNLMSWTPQVVRSPWCWLLVHAAITI